eukprot:6931062-Pyramimonas_sp.AAC.1
MARRCPPEHRRTWRSFEVTSPMSGCVPDPVPRISTGRHIDTLRGDCFALFSQVEKKVPYLPNTMLAFAPCHTSWHALRPLEVDNFKRDTIQGFVSFKQDVKKEKCPEGPGGSASTKKPNKEEKEAKG